MGRRKKLNLRDVVGLLKDKASLSKAILLSTPTTSTLHISLIQSTSHEPSEPPDPNHVAVLLSYGHSSRLTASSCVQALIHRLHSTRNSFVAFKCLMVFHYIINRGSFILQDQLSVHPGRSYLNLSNFQDNSTSESYNLCFWVRWYARFLETLLFTSTSLGFFLYFTLEKDEDRVSSLLNQDLLQEMQLLVTLVEEICRTPELFNHEANKLVHEAMSLVGEDKGFVQKKIMIRVNELSERIGQLSFSDSVELVCMLKRYESCNQKIVKLFSNTENSVGDRLWGLVENLKEKVSQGKEYCERRVEMKASRVRFSESARFSDRVSRICDSVTYGSGRLTRSVALSVPIIRDHI